MNGCYCGLVDHGEGIEVEGVALIVVAFLPSQHQFNYELFHIVIELIVAAQLLLLPFGQHKYLPFLALLLDDLYLELVGKIVADNEKWHDCVVGRGRF